MPIQQHRILTVVVVALAHPHLRETLRTVQRQRLNIATPYFECGTLAVAQGIEQQCTRDSTPPILRGHAEIENLQLSCDQPSDQIASHHALYARDAYARLRQSELSCELGFAPRMLVRACFDSCHRGDVAWGRSRDHGLERGRVHGEGDAV